MDDWQGCLSPECQSALLLARDNVRHRGGSVITVEDFLLALLDAISEIPPFLRRHSVDLDELVRTIQGEQPRVPEIAGDGDLSSQLIYWIAAARESNGKGWLGWAALFRSLVAGCERLQDKAYVAVLELVSCWPETAEMLPGQGRPDPVVPIALVDPAWLALSENVAVALAANPRLMVWVRGAEGSGKTTWLNSLLSTLGLPWVQVDPRREAEILANDHATLPTADMEALRWPVLVLDNTLPSELLAALSNPADVVRELVTGWAGPILMAGRNAPEEADAVAALSRAAGRTLEVLGIPPASRNQRLAILAAHQPAIEKRWHIQLSPEAMAYAASCTGSGVAMPGAMLEWVKKACARLDLFARRGPLEALSLQGQRECWQRRSLVALARGDAIGEPEPSTAELSIHEAAMNVHWYERLRAGTLRRLLVEDLRAEREQWVAARPGAVHYVRHCGQQHGECLGAGSGNLCS